MARREGGTSWKLQGFHKLEYVKGYAGKSVISVCKKAQKEEQMHFMAMKNSRKRSCFVVYSYFKDGAFPAGISRGWKVLN